MAEPSRIEPRLFLATRAGFRKVMRRGIAKTSERCEFEQPQFLLDRKDTVKQRKKMPIVGAVMTSFPYFVVADDPVTKLERMMDEHGIRHLPVQEKGKVVGIVSERDLHHRVSRETTVELKSDLRARDIMLANPYVATFNTPLNEVVSQMALRRIGSAIVLRRGKLAGILSAIDVCRIFAEYLNARFPTSGDSNEAA